MSFAEFEHLREEARAARHAGWWGIANILDEDVDIAGYRVRWYSQQREKLMAEASKTDYQQAKYRFGEITALYDDPGQQLEKLKAYYTYVDKLISPDFAATIPTLCPQHPKVVERHRLEYAASQLYNTALKAMLEAVEKHIAAKKQAEGYDELCAKREANWGRRQALNIINSNGHYNDMNRLESSARELVHQGLLPADWIIGGQTRMKIESLVAGVREKLFGAEKPAKGGKK